MPKPLEGVQGSGMHTHLSLFRGDDNAFFDADDDYYLSDFAKSFMAGLLHHAAEITAITNQTVNSYKRLVPGFEAPVHVSWARNNRSGLIRVPIAKRGNPTGDPASSTARRTRRATRTSRSACCWPPGMRGVAEGYELPVEADANLFEIGDEVLAKLGIEQLPQSLSDALRAMEKSELVHDALGEPHLRVVPAQQAHRVAGLQDPRVDLRDRPLPEGAVSSMRRAPSDAVVAGERMTTRAARRLRRARHARAGAHARPRRLPLEGRGLADEAAEFEPPSGWAGAIIDCGADATGAWAFARTIRKREPGQPAGAGARLGRPARRPRAARRAVRRLLPVAVPPGRAGGPGPPPAVARSAAAPGRT